MDTSPHADFKSLAAKPSLSRDECISVLHAMGCTINSAKALYGRIMDYHETVDFYALVGEINNIIVTAASMNDVTVLVSLFRNDVLDKSPRQHLGWNHAGFSAPQNYALPSHVAMHPQYGAPQSSPMIATPISVSGGGGAATNPSSVACTTAPLRLVEPLVMFAVHWQRYASSQIAHDFTSLAAAFNDRFPHIKLPEWLWQRACVQPTPSVEECFHFFTCHLPSDQPPAYWLVGGLKYAVRLEGSDLQRQCDSAKGDDALFLQPERIETDWVCPKQHALKHDLRSDCLDELGALLANALTLRPSQISLSEETLFINRGQRSPTFLSGVFPETVFQYVTRLLNNVPDVQSAHYDFAARRWHVVYRGNKPHDLLLQSPVDILTIERAA